MSETWVLTEHPDIEDSKVLRPLSSFNNLYKKKGWVLVPDEPAEVVEPAPTMKRSEAVKKSPKKKSPKKT